ncbi:hypothetical protein QF117_20190 [Vibrio sp. YMD68]|uniref:hypothetical protein n=1 Tax=Vibrio sp. YMD68 TaxID=3042300 RepID=UPI00249C9ED7|nr:hypothetical protein [Vibrio sp. YMD68]WGW00172.1 hypothetical protein QF117_20190 [Vibrio sp. YMD68]
MTLSAKKKCWGVSIALSLCLAVIVWSLHSTQNAHPQKNIRVSGSKPIDATVKVWANYWVHGESCESYSYDMFGRKAHQGGKITTFFTPNDIESNELYEFEVPYSTYTNSKNCVVELRDIKVEAYNAFDTVGFAQLRIYQAGNNYNNKPIDLGSKIEARDCNTFIHQWKDKTTSGGLGCNFYVDNKKSTTATEFNAYTVHFDFSQFNEDTVIHYDILAGDNYRSTPLDSQTGK